MGHNQGVYPVPTQNDREIQQQASQLLSLDLLLEFIKHMATRAAGVRDLFFCI